MNIIQIISAISSLITIIGAVYKYQNLIIPWLTAIIPVIAVVVSIISISSIKKKADITHQPFRLSKKLVNLLLLASTDGQISSCDYNAECKLLAGYGLIKIPRIYPVFDDNSLIYPPYVLTAKGSQYLYEKGLI